MAEGTEKGVFVVTFPLKTEKWHEDRIDKMMRLLTVLYKDKQRLLVARYRHLCHTDEFHAAKDAGLKEFRTFMNQNGFDKYSIEKVFADSAKSSSETNMQLLTHGLNSKIIQELSHRAFAAWDKKLYGNGKHIETEECEVNTFKSRWCKTGVTGFKVDKAHLTITMTASKPKMHEMFTIPFIVNRNSEYELFALDQELRNVAITRKLVRGTYKYYVQLSLAGSPYNKGRQIGHGVVGIDPGPRKMAVVGDNIAKVFPLAESINEDERKVARLQRKLNRSRRAMNPDNYNEDGTISRGKKTWIKSNHYIDTQRQLADHQRKLAAKRKIAHNELANELLQMGNEFRVENNNMQGWQKRSSKDSKTSTGKNRSKKRFGKSLKNHAPSEFLTILKNKVEQYAEGVYVDIPSGTACTQFDFTSGDFTKHELRERTITTSDGRVHDRDLLAAFNMKHVRKEKVVGKKKIEKSADNFNRKAMEAEYAEFCQMENKK